MSAIDQLFTQLRASEKKALMPFVTAGFPTLETTEAVLRHLGAAGADLCELGIPYSDPVADGPVIQASYQHALEQGFRLQDVFELGKRLDREGAMPRVTMPRVTMVSYSIIHRIGTETYVQKAKASGYAGAIVPDLLVEEAEAFAKVCQANDFDLIQLVTPTTPQSRQVRIANSSSGFLYYVSVTGITGERASLPEELEKNVRWLRGETDLPICIGFGISGAETAAQLAPVADGLIVGSAIVRRIAQSQGAEDAVKQVCDFVAELRRAMDTATAT
ncbi:MAG: tryptophan synthase subunit alpha [Novipirellula sp. JB048]